MIKGEIWWAQLPSPRGSEPGKTRPVLVIQGDSFNRSAINTVICAVITSNTTLSNAPANLLLEKSDSRLEKTSVVNFSQIVTLDKSFFLKQVSMLPKYFVSKIDTSLKLIFDIEQIK
jgi:mRNA interferase MazF